tara:strand:+ start:28398 stop:29264 length:867 start_codon:yes stop_codon:yes gene_type:complete
MKALTLLFLVSLFLIPQEKSVAQETGDPLYTAELGVQMYTFRNILQEQGLEATLDIVKDMGFKYVEGGGARGVTTKEYLQMLADRGLSVPSTGTGYQQLIDDPQAVADQAKALGAKYVMCSWVNHDTGNFNFLNASEAVEVFNKAGKVLAENGITFMYHMHGYEFVPHREGTLMDYIFENTDPEYVSFEMDILWTHFGGGNPTHLLQKYEGRFKALHLKDLRKGTLKDHTGLTPGTNDVILGAGEIDIPGILREANKQGIKYMFIEDESPDPLYQVPESIKYLKSLTY